MKYTKLGLKVIGIDRNERARQDRRLNEEKALMVLKLEQGAEQIRSLKLRLKP